MCSLQGTGCLCTATSGEHSLAGWESTALVFLSAPAEGHRQPNTSQGKDFKAAWGQTSSLCVRVQFLCVPSVKAHSGCWAVRADLGCRLCLAPSGIHPPPVLVQMCLPEALSAHSASQAHFSYLCLVIRVCSVLLLLPPAREALWLAEITRVCTKVHCTTRHGPSACSSCQAEACCAPCSFVRH